MRSPACVTPRGWWPAPASAPTAKGPAGGGPGKRKAVVEVPPLELEPDFETATTDRGHDVDDEPLAIEEPERACLPSGVKAR